MEKKTCCYVYTKGKSMNSQCKTKIKDDQDYCFKHMKFSTIINEVHDQKLDNEDKCIEDKGEENPVIIKLPKAEESNSLNIEEDQVLDKNEQDDRKSDDEQEEEDYPQGGQILLDNQDKKLEETIDNYMVSLPWLHDLLPERTIESSSEWLSKINTLVENRQMDLIVKSGFNATTSIFESIVCAKGINIEGYSDVLSSNPEIDQLLSLLRLQHMSDIKISPEMKLLGICAFSAVSIYNVNKTKASLDNIRRPQFKE